MTVELTDSARAFVEGLELCDCTPRVEHGVIVFEVQVVTGTHTGEAVQTGVAQDELGGWPVAPPHWIHFPQSVSVGATNSKQSPLAGWLMHSRNIIGWGSAKEPAQEWLAHVQSVLQGAAE